MRDGTEPQPQTKRDLAAWDAEIEEEFQRVVAATKTAGRKKGSAWLDSRSPSWPTSAG